MKLDKSKKYLFICAYGQSRSRYFSERFMEMGIKSLFCGYVKDADIVYNQQLMRWADEIVVLDNYFEKTSEGKYCEKKYIKFYIDDEPSLHKHRFREFMELFK
jgi:predicted protein tyrosine phosphatase